MKQPRGNRLRARLSPAHRHSARRSSLIRHDFCSGCFASSTFPNRIWGNTCVFMHFALMMNLSGERGGPVCLSILEVRRATSRRSLLLQRCGEDEEWSCKHQLCWVIHAEGAGEPPVFHSNTFPAIPDWPLKNAVHIIPRAAKYKWQQLPASICPHDQLETPSSLSHGLIDGCDLLCAE